MIYMSHAVLWKIERKLFSQSATKAVILFLIIVLSRAPQKTTA